ncbi:hemolysin family protein [Actinopolymorpha pittospori]
MSWQPALAVTLGLLLASGFFVASEFALVGARRHRIEQAARAGVRGAAAALAGIRRLSFMLAGAQLGITMCMIGLGMVSEPTLHHYLEPVLATLGLPAAASDVIALVVALVAVTYLHVVVGEMAPKSWVITDPDRSAMLLAPVFRAFTSTLRPLIGLLNGISNLLLRLCRVSPRDEIVNVRNREQIHHLVDESHRLGLIAEEDYRLLTRTIGAAAAPIQRILVPAEHIVTVADTAPPQTVVDIAQRSGRTRLVVVAGAGDIVGAIHVRNALLARAKGSQTPAGALATPIPTLTHDTDLAGAVGLLRERRAQLCLVRDELGHLLGLVSFDDLLGAITTDQGSPTAEAVTA